MRGRELPEFRGSMARLCDGDILLGENSLGNHPVWRDVLYLRLTETTTGSRKSVLGFAANSN